MYGSINAPTAGNKTFQNFAANVRTTDEPGLNVTVPFTPPSANTSASVSSAAAVPTGSNSNNSPLSSAAALPSSSGAAPPSQSAGAAGSVTAGSTVVVGLAVFVAVLVI